MGYSYLSTSRGGGNKLPAIIVVFVNCVYSSLSTSRGAGNTYKSIPLSDSQSIAPYLPREGPETNYINAITHFFNFV